MTKEEWCGLVVEFEDAIKYRTECEQAWRMRSLNVDVMLEWDQAVQHAATLHQRICDALPASDR